MIVFTGGKLIEGFVYHRKYTLAYHRSRPYWHRHDPPLHSEPDA